MCVCHWCTAVRLRHIWTDAVACLHALEEFWFLLSDGSGRKLFLSRGQRINSYKLLGQLGKLTSAVSTGKWLPHVWSTRINTHGPPVNLWWWVFVMTAVYILVEVVINCHHSPETLNPLLCIWVMVCRLQGIFVQMISCPARAWRKIEYRWICPVFQRSARQWNKVLKERTSAV